MKEILLAFSALAVVLVSLKLGFDYRLPAPAVFALYLGLYMAARAWVSRNDEAAETVGADWPTSGPIGKFGQRGLILGFTISGLFAILNPWQLLQIIAQTVGNTWLYLRGAGAEDFAKQYENQTRYRLPFAGEWLVYNGGTRPATSHSWGLITQRYAYDCVIAGAQHVRHSGAGTRLEDYYAYGAPILAAAAGTVIKVEDRISDAPWVGYGIVDIFARNFAGNHVIIQHAEQEFGFYAHLIKGKILVRPGDQVAAGQPIGHCGHSGHSSEPHLPFPLQDGPSFYLARGLPISFSNVLVDGLAQDSIQPTAGQRLAPAK